MSSRPFIIHQVSATQPTGQQVGDEWFNPTTNILTKTLAVNGTSVLARQVLVDATGNLRIPGNITVVGNLDSGGVMRSASVSIATDTVITPTAGITNQYNVLALATAATIAIPSGGPIDGQRLTIRIKDNGTARALTWITTAGGYRAVGVSLPTTTVISKVVYIGCVYNAQDGFWDVLAVGQLP